MVPQSRAQDFWIKRPCVNARPSIAIREHERGRSNVRTGSKTHTAQRQALFDGGKRLRTSDAATDVAQSRSKFTIHQKAQAFLNRQIGMEKALQTQHEKQKEAILKRMMAVDYIARSYQSFESYEGLVALLAKADAFHDCPQSDDAGSFDSQSASYTSRGVCTDMLRALAMSIRTFWMGTIDNSPRGSVVADESGDAAQRTQLLQLYKILLPTSHPIVIYAGIDALPRGTAAIIEGAIWHRLALDHIDKEKALQWLACVCFDTCSTMFGCNAGVATRLMKVVESLIANRCVSHRKALGLKHAAE